MPPVMLSNPRKVTLWAASSELLGTRQEVSLSFTPD
jgi:hypothetical protein